jgi:uncharacterized protein YndB with AHSA1/START domain
MVTRTSYDVTARSEAAPERVFAALADAPSWKRWAGPMVLQSWWEREGEPAPGGVGAIRRLGMRGASSREQIVAFDPPRHLAYVWLTRIVRDYRADVRLEPDGTGTRIHWSGSFVPTRLVPGAVGRAFFTRTVGGFARRLAVHAEQHPAPPGPVEREQR